MSGQRPRVGIDNYGLYPLNLGPLDTLRWARSHGAEGVAFSGLPPEQQATVTRTMLRDVACFARENGLYVEWGGGQHIPRDMTSWARKEVASVNRTAAEQAVILGTRVVRSCSGGLMRWNAEAPPTETLLRETAQALREQRSMLSDHGVVLAIETHFEFTSHELVRLLEWCEAEPGGWLGICLDTMNLLTMLEDPASATRRLLPWVVSSHIKDGAVLLDETGLTTFTAPIGEGSIDLEQIVSLIASLGRDVNLSVEDHGGSFHLPVFDAAFLSRFPDLTAPELARLIRMSCRGEGPGPKPLPREEWPAACASRITADIAALLRLASS